MRTGRLESTTLASIWRALDADSNAQGIPTRIHKEYIPSTMDSPLYRLLTVPLNAQSERSPPTIANEQNSSFESNRNQIAEETPLSFLVHGPIIHRGVSVPNLGTEQLDNYLPLPRVVQSTNDLFSEERQTRPALVSRSISFVQNPMFSLPKQKSWEEDYAHIDIDWSMQAMDVLYNASFYDYIRDERNVELSAVRLSRLVKDYKPKQVANALTWMIQGWSIENSAKLFRIIFSDWLPDLAGCVFALVTKAWSKKIQCSLCTAYILISEPAPTVAVFLRSLTQGWERSESIEIITYLDSVLKWETPYLQEVMTIYSDSMFSEQFGTPGLSISTSDHQADILAASRRLMIANARLAMAEYQLALFSHWSTCAKCQNREECEELNMMDCPEIGLRSKSFLECGRTDSMTDLSIASLDTSSSSGDNESQQECSLQNVNGK